MGNVIKIGITKNSNQKIDNVNTIKLISGKGIVGDRHFHEYNNARNQITLIESENIDYYNKKFNLKIQYIDLRRNIVTQDINLNELVGKKIKIGETLLLVNDLCKPCKHLQDSLKLKNIVKEFLLIGGIRCEILTGGRINIKDKIII